MVKKQSEVDQMEGFYVVSALFWCVIIALIVLCVVSFTLFIRRLLINSSAKHHHIAEVEKKLDKIIELLEKDRVS